MYAEKASRSNLTAGYSTGRTAEGSEVSAGMLLSNAEAVGETL